MKKLFFLFLLLSSALLSRAGLAQSYFFPDHYERYFSISFPTHWQLQNHANYTRLSPYGQWDLIYMDIWSTGATSIQQAWQTVYSNLGSWLNHNGLPLLDQRHLNDGMYLESYGTSGQLSDGSTADYLVTFLHRDPSGRYPGAGIYALGVYLHHAAPNRQAILQQLDQIGYSIEAVTPAGGVTQNPGGSEQETYLCSKGEQLIVTYLPDKSVNIAKAGEFETITLPFIETRSMNDYYGNGQVIFVSNFDEAWLEETPSGHMLISGCNPV